MSWTNRRLYDIQVTIDHMTGYCQCHHPSYAQVGSPKQPATVAEALAAAAPGKTDDQLPMPSPGKRRGKKEKCKPTTPITQPAVTATTKVVAEVAQKATVAFRQPHNDP